jgi:hypothetical protein
MKRLFVTVAVSGALLGGGVAIPLTLTAQPAYAAAPGGPWVIAKAFECANLNSGKTGTLYVNTVNGRGLCFLG